MQIWKNNIVREENMSVLDWNEDDLEMKPDEDFVAVANQDSHNREVLHCILSDPDCETCQ